MALYLVDCAIKSTISREIVWSGVFEVEADSELQARLAAQKEMLSLWEFNSKIDPFRIVNSIKKKEEDESSASSEETERLSHESHEGSPEGNSGQDSEFPS